MSHPLPAHVSSQQLVRVTRPSFLLITRHIYKSQGLAGFFRGLGPTLLRAFPVNASAIFVYEGIMTELGAEKVHFSPLPESPSHYEYLADEALTELEYGAAVALCLI
jgi:Mitochondrial carrier protein